MKPHVARYYMISLLTLSIAVLTAVNISKANIARGRSPALFNMTHDPRPVFDVQSNGALLH